MYTKIIMISFILATVIFPQNKINKITSDSVKSSGVIYGENYAFSVTSPKGWILDNKSGLAQGIKAVFYPKGGSWDKSPEVLYINTAEKNIHGNETIDKVISTDEHDFKNNYPDVEISDGPILRTRNNKKIIIKKFHYNDNYEAVAYFDETNTIPMFVLSAKSRKGFDKAYQSFVQLISSYQNLKIKSGGAEK